MRKFFITSIIYIVVTAGSALGNIPDPWEITVSMPGVGEEEVVLFVLPAGSGSSFYEAQIRDDGSTIDAHIEMVLEDGFGNPVANYPKEDLWLESGDNGMVPCFGGSCPDADTDQNGVTYWETPLHAGGHSEAFLYVAIGRLSWPVDPLSMSFVSADINGDGAVNLSDVGQFSFAYFGEYDFAADFFSDGVLNLADVGRLALGIGESCP